LQEISTSPGPGGFPISAGVDAFGPNGRTFTFRIGSELYLWRDDTAETIDIGVGGVAVFSPDSKRFIYGEFSTDQTVVYKGYDIPTRATAVIGSSKYAGNVGLGLTTAMFAPDSRHAVLYTNLTTFSGEVGDLVTFEFGSNKTTTLVPQMLRVPFGSAVAFLASGHHLLFSTNPAPAGNGAEGEAFAYDMADGTRTSLGTAKELTAIPGGAFAAFTSATGDVTVIDDATWTPRVIASTRTGPTNPANAGFQPSPDGKWLAFVDAARTFHLWDLGRGTDAFTLGDQGSCFTDPKTVWFARARAAIFTSDGRSIVHGIKDNCDAAVDSFSGLGRIDLGSMTETTFDIGASLFKSYSAVSASGQIAYADLSLTAPMLQTWQGGPPIALDFPPESPNSSSGPTFVFSADERYLFYTAHATLVVRDGQSGTTTRLGTTTATFTNPVKSVSVAWFAPGANTGPLTAYAADGGGPVTLATSSALYPIVSPSTSALAYTYGDIAGDGVYLYTFAPRMPGTLIENGKPQAMSDHILVFRDLDGLCLLPY
jgi:hypothetical protein